MRQLLLTLCMLGAAMLAYSQEDEWPLVIKNHGYIINIYEPQPESFDGIKFSARAAVSIKKDKSDPVFGAIWMNGKLLVDRDNRMGSIESVTISDARFPTIKDTSRIASLKKILAEEIPKVAQPIAIDRIVASLDKGQKSSDEFAHNPPEIIYTTKPSVLVYIDGDAVFQDIPNSDYEHVVNTPFFIARKKDGSTCYLNGNAYWYEAKQATGPWKHITYPPQELVKMAPPDTSAKQPSKDIPEIIVRTKQAELIQSEGAANFKPIQGTNLLYMTNTEGDVFMDITSQEYYILVSGRWYTSKSLDKGPWAYIASDKLPADFAKIPEGSDKDAVLASVAGTQASKEAVLDAQIPQTAKVDRKTATTKVTYDGKPDFKPIPNTAISYAVNTSSTVLKIDNQYYVCDNAVWFTGNAPDGPWQVCDKVPDEVQKIPPSSPVYSVKYVYVYDVTPDYIYMGYTPGYMGCYVYGPTVIYGTGFYYNPWYGPYYYPRPVTWGFAIHYNPWTGWSMAFGFSAGWFHMGFVGYHGGGWFGPPMYRPPVVVNRRPVYINNNINVNRTNNINVNNRNNIYSNHTNGVSPTRHPNGRQQNLSGQTMHTGARGNDLSVDHNGNVYNRSGNNIQQRNQGGWQNVDHRQAPAQVNHTYENRDRGSQRVEGFNQSRGYSRPAPSRPAGGGGMRRGR